MSLYSHQKKILKEKPSYHGLWWECGTGKSLAAIKLVEANKIKKCLILCPKTVKQNWYREVEKWGTGVTEWTIATKEEFKAETAFIMGKKLDGVILDEAHFWSGYKSLLFKKTLKYFNATQPKCVYLLTATPYLSTPYNVMCYENLLGGDATWTNYRNRYFYTRSLGGKQIPVIKPNIKDELADTLKKIGTPVRKKACIDLPEEVFIREDFNLTAKQFKAIKDLDDDPTSIARIVYWTKRHQIGGGTLKTENGYDEIGSDKMSRLKNYCSERDKVVVVCRYRAELDMLEKYLKKNRIKTLRMDGSTNNRQDIIDKANKVDKCTFLVNASVSEGYNLTGFDTMVFYSHSFSFKDYVQMKGRIHRIGQTKKCTYIEFVVNGDIDDDVLKNLEQKRDFDIAIYDKFTSK